MNEPVRSETAALHSRIIMACKILAYSLVILLAVPVFARTDGPMHFARNNPEWIPNAMKAHKNMKVFVATGRYDPLNMCEGDVIVTAKLSPDMSSRITNHCYEGGHMM